MLFILTVSALVNLVIAQSSAIEPPAGKLFFGAWLDTSNPPVGTGDRPAAFNARMGFNASAFQYAQNTPLLPGIIPAPDSQVTDLGPNVFKMLTIYARPWPWSVTDEDIKVITDQCKSLNVDKKVMLLLRFSPEMNGNWIEYGQQPVQYKKLWIRVAQAVRQNCHLTNMVWAPSQGVGYPFGGQPVPGTEEFTALDTNKDGKIDANDDPYSPYYPGDQYVDWIGISVYTYGIKWPWIDNVVAAPGKFENIINFFGFYDKYCRVTGKPCMVAEGGAAFHLDSPNGPGVGELAVKQSFWRQWITNTTLMDAYPRLKMFNVFEFRKYEEDTLRDFSISVNDDVRNAFIQDFQSVKSRYMLGTLAGVENMPSIPQASKSGTNCLGISVITLLVLLIF